MNPTQPFLCIHDVQKRLGIGAGSLCKVSRSAGQIITQTRLIPKASRRRSKAKIVQALARYANALAWRATER